MGNFFRIAVNAVAGVLADRTRRIDIGDTTLLIAENVPRSDLENAVKSCVEDPFLMKSILSAISAYDRNSNAHDDYLKSFGFTLQGISTGHEISSSTWQESCFQERVHSGNDSRGASFGIALIRANNNTHYDLYVAQSSATIRLNFWQRLVDTPEKSQQDLQFLSATVLENVKNILEQEALRRIIS